jgi:hypothetical protein
MTLLSAAKQEVFRLSVEAGLSHEQALAGLFNRS